MRDREWMRELGRRGGYAKAERARAARARAEPLTGSILDFLGLLGSEFQRPSWAPWRTFLKALFGLPLDAAELTAFTTHTGRDVAPMAPFSEAWAIVGRRGGKSRMAALVAAYLATRDYRAVLAPGERGVVMCIAADRRQARVVLRYLRALFEQPPLNALVGRMLIESIELRHGVSLEVHSASYRTTRGYTVVGAIADEIGYWRTDEWSAEPDTEVLAAIRPAMATVPGALLLAISTPYARRGELFKAYERHYGHADSPVLVWRAPTVDMNPLVPEHVVADAVARDPVTAASEFGAEWRRDIELLFTPEALDPVIMPERELPPRPGVAYRAFVDPSGGSQDSFTVAIAHRERDVGVLDVVREIRAPFSPDAAVSEYARLLHGYRVTEVTGDAYAGEWPRERFAAHRITYRPSEMTKSALYLELVASVNAGRVRLVRAERLRWQLLGLERRTARSGKDSVDHAPGGHDDVANAAAGVLVTLLTKSRVTMGGFSANI